MRLEQSMKSNLLPLGAAMLALGLGALPAQAQNVKPPKAQLWMDISTGGMAGMPEMDSGMGAMLAWPGCLRKLDRESPGYDT